jgi:hypothetical protein
MRGQPGFFDIDERLKRRRARWALCAIGVAHRITRTIDHKSFAIFTGGRPRQVAAASAPVCSNSPRRPGRSDQLQRPGIVAKIDCPLDRLRTKRTFRRTRRCLESIDDVADRSDLAEPLAAPKTGCDGFHLWRAEFVGGGGERVGSATGNACR